MSRRGLLPELVEALKLKKRTERYADPFSLYNPLKKPLDVNQKQGMQSNGFWRGTEYREPEV